MLEYALIGIKLIKNSLIKLIYQKWIMYEYTHTETNFEYINQYSKEPHCTWNVARDAYESYIYKYV